jgi:hypothetical protein
MLHEDDQDFPTHENGTNRIDYLLCTPNVLQYITQIGYVPFNGALDSDHRAVFCDLNGAIFEAEIEEIPKRVRLVGTNSTNKEGTKYVRCLYNRLQEHKIFDQIEELLAKVSTTTTDSDKVSIVRQLNQIDDEITRLMLLAEEKTCKKKYAALWTPTLEQSHLVIQYWCVKIKSQKQQTDSSKRLNSIIQRMTSATKSLIHNTNTSMTIALKDAITNHKEILANSYELRLEYLQGLVKDMNERGTSAQVATVKGIIHREQTRHDFQTIRRCLKEISYKGLTSIEVPCEDNPNKWRTLQEPLMTPKLVLRNTSHFSQADGTPFSSHPLKTIFGYEGTNQIAKELVDKQTVPTNLIIQDQYTQSIIDQLSDGNNLPTNQEDITFDEFKAAFINWKENTTTSPSGRHLGHYKLLTRLPVLDNQNNNLSEIILNLYYNVTKIAASIGTSLNRWKNISTMMIEKDKGSPKIHRLRVIHIYEADYNLMLKVVWARKTVWGANDKNALNEGQAGSRPGRRAIDVVLQKEMKYLYARLTRTQLGTIDNDAASCYDRILCNLAMLISKYYGVPDKYCSVQADNLRYSIYKTRAALGDSSLTYTHTDTTPIHGTGQGSCASPAIWLLISSFIMTILQKTANRMTIEDLDPTEQNLLQWIEGFVDDTSIFTNTAFDNTNISQLRQRLEQDGTLWSGLLKATGGKLEMQKCFYYLLGWKWKPDGTAVPLTIDETDPDQVGLSLESSNGTRVLLQQKEVQDSHKTLGVYKNLCGNNTVHFQYLKQKCYDMAEKIRNSQLNRRQARRAYSTHYLSSLTYSLTAATLTRRQLEELQKIIIEMRI